MKDSKCPVCESQNVTTSVEADSFQYGEDGPDAVMLTVEVPFMKCADCDFRYTDNRAEHIKDTAVRRHMEETAVPE